MRRLEMPAVPHGPADDVVALGHPGAVAPASLAAVCARLRAEDDPRASEAARRGAASGAGSAGSSRRRPFLDAPYWNANRAIEHGFTAASLASGHRRTDANAERIALPARTATFLTAIDAELRRVRTARLAPESTEAPIVRRAEINAEVDRRAAVPFRALRARELSGTRRSTRAVRACEPASIARDALRPARELAVARRNAPPTAALTGAERRIADGSTGYLTAQGTGAPPPLPEAERAFAAATGRASVAQASARAAEFIASGMPERQVAAAVLDELATSVGRPAFGADDLAEREAQLPRPSRSEVVAEALLDREAVRGALHRERRTFETEPGRDARADLAAALNARRTGPIDLATVRYAVLRHARELIGD